MKTLLHILYGILIGLLAAGLIWLAASRPRGEAVTLLPTSTPGMVTVYVSGAVAAPGVYSLPAGSRAEAVIEAAGGFLPQAEQASINLAQLLTDGQQIDVPEIGDAGQIVAERVNINTATPEELDALPGIGPATAQAIVDYRLENGPFQFIEDIRQVPGIGPATFEDIQDSITIGP